MNIYWFIMKWIDPKVKNKELLTNPMEWNGIWWGVLYILLNVHFKYFSYRFHKIKIVGSRPRLLKKHIILGGRWWTHGSATH